MTSARLKKAVSALVLSLLAFSQWTAPVWADSSILTLDQIDDEQKLHLNLVGRPRIGLALGGGGTRGAAHVGVLRKLKEAGVPIDCIVGTSMGAVVGGLYSAGIQPDQIERMFLKEKLMKEFLTVPLGFRVAIIPILFIPRLVGYKALDGLYRGNKFRNFLVKAVPQTERNIQDLKIPFGAVTLNLLDGNTCTLKSGNLGYALQASTAVPVLRRPVGVDGKLLVDGGVLDNLPVKETRSMGADIVIAVDVDERFEPVDPKVFRAVGSVAHRVMTLHLAKVDDEQRHNADVVIHPKVNGISLISTSKKDLKTAITAGEVACTLALPEILEKLKKEGVVLNQKTHTLQDAAETVQIESGPSGKSTQ